jgi:hypothetical protein
MDSVRKVIRTWEADLPITGAMDVPFEDWPSHIQDAIYGAMDKLSEEHKCPIAITYARYKTDADKDPEQPGHHYLHIILSEVVMADERTLDPGTVVRGLPETLWKN